MANKQQKLKDLFLKVLIENEEEIDSESMKEYLWEYATIFNLEWKGQSADIGIYATKIVNGNVVNDDGKIVKRNVKKLNGQWEPVSYPMKMIAHKEMEFFTPYLHYQTFPKDFERVRFKIDVFTFSHYEIAKEEMNNPEFNL